MKKNLVLIAGVTLMSLVGTQSAVATPPTGLSNLLGTWTNVNSTTGGIVKVTKLASK